jgi:arylsulfatase A-like enzyme
MNEQKWTISIAQKLISVLLLIVFMSACEQEKEQKRPNIIYIMSDDHTSQAWGIYGGVLEGYVQTDNIKQLAKEGTVLNNAFCTNSICTPSRGSVMTGQYSHVSGIYNLRNPLDPSRTNVAKELQKGGYQTAIIGKWHLHAKPAGFDYFNVLPNQGKYWNPKLKTEDIWEDGGKGGKEYEGFSTDVITDLSLDWIKNREEEKPFFLMCHFKATHEPFDYPERFKDLYKDVTIPEPASLQDAGPEETNRTFRGQILEVLGQRWETASKKPDEWWTTYPGLPFSTEGLDKEAARKKIYQKLVKDFMRSGAAIDDNIGKILSYLKENDLEENTVVIYCADQGYFLGEHGFFDKRLIYEESMRMPFVIKYPKEVKQGQRLDDIILNVDYPALFLDYAELEKPEYMQGRSFRNNLKGNTPEDWRESMYYRYFAHDIHRPAHFGLRNQDYTLAFFYGRGLGLPGANNDPERQTIPAWEFYDLKKDPYQTNNAYNDPQYSETIKSMKEEILKKRRALGDTDQQHSEMKDIIEKYWD